MFPFSISISMSPAPVRPPPPSVASGPVLVGAPFALWTVAPGNSAADGEQLVYRARHFLGPNSPDQNSEKERLASSTGHAPIILVLRSGPDTAGHCYLDSSTMAQCCTATQRSRLSGSVMQTDCPPPGPYPLLRLCTHLSIYDDYKSTAFPTLHPASSRRITPRIAELSKDAQFTIGKTLHIHKACGLLPVGTTSPTERHGRAFANFASKGRLHKTHACSCRPRSTWPNHWSIGPSWPDHADCAVRRCHFNRKHRIDTKKRKCQKDGHGRTPPASGLRRSLGKYTNDIHRPHIRVSAQSRLCPRATSIDNWPRTGQINVPGRRHNRSLATGPMQWMAHAYVTCDLPY